MEPNMNKALTFIILFVLTACETTSSNNTSIDKPIMSCKQNKNLSVLNKNFQNDSVEVEALDGLNILIADTKIPIAKKTTFDKAGLYNLFKTEYFWADKTPRNLNINNYNEPQKLIDDAKYSVDRWSFAITPEIYNNAISQKSVGFGFACQNINLGCLITMVRIDSPADKIDLRRGDIIQKIDGAEVTRELIYTKGQEDKSVEFEILRQNSDEICTGNVTPREYTYKVVEYKTIKNRSSKEIGYLRLDSFLGDDKILAQLDNAFEYFQKKYVEKLVIDLRYNGGGSVDLASKLLDKLAINRKNQTQFTLAWNNNYTKKNQVYKFKHASNALDLKQIIFLTTRATASASELVISAMKPYLPEEDIVIIGDKTHGKPVGMNGQSDGSYYYFLINFVVQNSLGFYDYFEGLPVTTGCNVKDDPFHEMGDPKESMFKSALQYINRGSCQ
ncbi:MAG: hypothetical protein DSZ07_05615 [Sulfurovum sp.]|nr:MAG: hypothetical protein DSZ07_05615 [Sulfurovum sp.]